MNQHSSQIVEDRLRQSEIQEEIRSTLQNAQENITVTISKAASLFNLTEGRLREWDRKGLLQTERLTLSQESKGAPGHRQYSSAELEKLAIISVLLKNGVSIGDIPSNVDELWHKIAGSESGIKDTHLSPVSDRRAGMESLHIDHHIEEIDRQGFWRYFVSQTLRLALRLICEDVPDSLAGIILPLENRKIAETIQSPEELPQLGFSLVGWLGRTRSFYTLLSAAPSFEYPSDYRLERLVLSDRKVEWDVQKQVLIVLQRRAKNPSLSPELIDPVCRMLELLYAREERWKSSFEVGTHDWFYQAHDLERASSLFGDLVFNSLLERIIELGGKGPDGQTDRWSFCCLLIPNDANLPIQQQTLVVRAQTELSPYEIGVTLIDQSRTDSLSQKAFLSGQIISFDELLPGQSMISYLHPSAMTGGSAEKIMIPEDFLETETRSAIALPLIGEDGISIAVLHVASQEPRAFTSVDQRVLRLMGRMLEELLQTSRMRQQVIGKLGNIITWPKAVDPTFQGFGSETDFLLELEAILQNLQVRIAGYSAEDISKLLEEELTILSVDIDQQSVIALKYGNRVARNLSHQVGMRILRQGRFSDRYLASKVFHIAADKYYWLLPGVSLKEAQDLAWQLKEILEANYKISPSYIVPGMAPVRPVQPENMLEITGITVHLGVSSYSFAKLAELLKRYSESASAYVQMLLVGEIEELLERGKASGGDCIFSWMLEDGRWKMESF